MGKRDNNRAERREQALHAARLLIAEGGPEALSMRQLSTVAGLAVNTLYALFGSRDGVVAAVIEDGIANTGDALGEIEARDPLELALALVTHAVNARQAAEAYTRPLYRALATTGVHKDAGMKRAAPLLLRILQRGVAVELLRDDVDLRLLVDHILRAFVHASMRWAFNDTTAAEYEAEATYVVVLALSASSTHAGRHRTDAALRTAEEQSRRAACR